MRQRAKFNVNKLSATCYVQGKCTGKVNHLYKKDMTILNKVIGLECVECNNNPTMVSQRDIIQN